MPDTSSMVENIVELIPYLLALLNVIVAVAAVTFAILGLTKLARYAQHGSYGPVRPTTPWMFLLSSALLWNFGMAATSMLETLYGGGTATDNLLSYTPSNNMPEETSEFLAMLIMLIRFYGYYALAKGFYKIHRIGSGNEAPDQSAFGSATWHIIGGAAAINIVATVNAFTSVLGFGEVL